ncbi:unnamed protein product [Amoebophrya sp. A120]|nr:unnamed protein product [Amoebophrya sp. A120]|eukprot:GSA120T00016235001.1
MLKKVAVVAAAGPLGGGVVAAATKKDHTTTTHSWEGSETLPAGFMEHERLASQALAQCIGMKTRSAAEFKAEFCENDKTEWTADKFTFTDHCNDWADLCSSNCTNGMATCPQDFDNQQRDCCNPGRPRSTLVEQVKSNVEQVKESMGFNSNTLNF